MMANSVGAKYAPIEIVPDANCVLVVGPEMVRIPASSRFLSAASEPFRAIFGAETSEGSDLRGRVDLVEITLPEDDATAVQLLCALIHHRNDMIPNNLPIHTVLSIAVTADKYDCIRVLKFVSESWFHSDSNTTSDLLVLAAAAYLLDNGTAFRRITKKMILVHNGPFTAIPSASVETIMDWRLLGKAPARQLGCIVCVADKAA